MTTSGAPPGNERSRTQRVCGSPETTAPSTARQSGPRVADNADELAQLLASPVLYQQIIVIGVTLQRIAFALETIAKVAENHGMMHDAFGAR